MPTAFRAATDYAFFEAWARDAGLDVARIGTGPLQHLSWLVSGRIRGRERDIALSVPEVAAPVRMHVVTQINHIAAHSDIQFIELSRRRCRMTVTVGLVPKSIAARLIVHSLRLSRPRLTRRLNRGLGQFARIIAKRARHLPD